ncbi:MAG: phospholipid carrier-dependent glycosyltransferase [bacterium]|nr:phospholipid carrier-dependent glycosyltransferase [bacterium]
MPFFQGPDEQVHYATIQYLAEPEIKSWPITVEREKSQTGSDISTYGFSEETIKSAQATQFDEVKFQNENTQEFSQSPIGVNENEVVRDTWKRYIDIYPTNTSGAASVYYFLGTKIEQLLSQQSILTRFLSIRLLSVALGALVVWLAYLTTQKIGLSRWQSLIIAALVAFQPMFSATAAIVNIDVALIFAFSLFIYAGTVLLQYSSFASWRISWKYIALLIFSIILGLFSKGSGIVLIVVAIPLLTYLTYIHFHIDKRRFFWRVFFLLSLLIALTFVFVPKSYFISIANLDKTSQFSSPLTSLQKYINKTIGGNGLSVSHASYWGNFGWLDTKISPKILDVIRIIELIAFLGVILYLISGTRPFDKLRVTEEKSHLPQKRYIIFFIGIILALQLAIRFYDWRVFDATKQIVIGTPGRYFLPNIIPHILLIVTGLGFFTRNEKQFHILLKILALLMILLSLYSMIDVIIPRYYL